MTGRNARLRITAKINLCAKKPAESGNNLRHLKAVK